MAHFCDQEYEASANAATVTVSLLSYTQAILKLDNVRTEYSAWYLVDSVCPTKQAGQRETVGDRSKLTAKDYLEFVMKEGITKEQSWPHLGYLFKPSASYIPPLVSMKGQVLESKNWDEAKHFFKQQSVGARLHVFSPELDEHIGEERIGEVLVVVVELYYNKKVAYVNVALDAMFLGASSSDESQLMNPETLLVGFFLPRLSIN